jgi:hypothetical protein
VRWFRVQGGGMAGGYMLCERGIGMCVSLGGAGAAGRWVCRLYVIRLAGEGLGDVGGLWDGVG